MREIALFVEDYAHQSVIGELVRRIANDYETEVNLEWRNAVRGHGRVVQEFRTYMADLSKQAKPLPDLIIVATDANCKGLNERNKEIKELTIPANLPPVVNAIPDPHIEKWLLLDSAAFRDVFGRGHDAPEQKCVRDFYKQKLMDAIVSSGIRPSLGGIEFAEDLIKKMDIERASRSDRSLKAFLDALRDQFQQWQD